MRIFFWNSVYVGGPPLKCQYTLVAYPVLSFKVQDQNQISGPSWSQVMKICSLTVLWLMLMENIFCLNNSQKFQHHSSTRNVVSLGIPSDFTSEWITLFSNRKMTTRYLYRLIILPRLPADKLWCVRTRRVPYGRIFTLEITWNFTWNYKWFYKWMDHNFL